MNKKDVETLRGLAARAAEIAALPVQEEKRSLWRKLNARRPERPMVMIDQVCWNEMNAGGELTLLCSDVECRRYEESLRRTLFQWEHFPVDMVVEPFIRVDKAVYNTGFGIRNVEDVAVTDPTNDVVGHKFANQFETDEDLWKVKMPEISHDPAETERRLSVARELFDGLLEIRLSGLDPGYESIWDPISCWMGAGNVLYALADRPEFMHRLAGRVTEGYLSLLDSWRSRICFADPRA